MKLTRAIYSGGFLFILLCSILALWGFWPSYYSNPFRISAIRVHFHGVFMSLWFVLLISQTLLIRQQNFPLHRLLGKTSYFLAALIFIGLLIVVQHIMASVVGSESTVKYRGTFFIFFSTLLFGVCYLWAVYRRKDPPTHGRIMLCTLFPLLPPATDRIIMNLTDSVKLSDMLISLVYVLFGLLVFVLSVWDWRSHKRLDVFPKVLITMIIFHTLVWFAPEIELWRYFADWFGAI